LLAKYIFLKRIVQCTEPWRIARSWNRGK